MSTRAGGVLCKDGWEVRVVVQALQSNAMLKFYNYKVKHSLSQVVFGGEVDKMSQVREDERRE